MEQAIYRRMRDLEDRHWWFQGRRSIVIRQIERLGLPQDASILDAGCGTGGNLPMLGRFGHVTGVEYDAGARVLARSRGETEILAGSLPDGMPSLEHDFDLIVLLDVLEHIDDDLASLQTLGRLLRVRGSILVTVPANPSMWGRHDEVHHHKRRYTSASLRSVIERAGLYVDCMTYFNTWLFPVAWAARQMERLTPCGKEAADYVSLPPAPLNSALQHIFASERYMVGRIRLPFGLSLMAVARNR
jgi:SAM-dependent methyltransferase